MSITQDEMQAIVEFRIEKALRAYEQAKGNVANGYWEVVANRLYYAAFDAVSALLIVGGDTAQTHSGVAHLFNLRFIKSGALPSEYGRLYHNLFGMRQTGDYDDAYELTEKDVLPFIEPTGKMIADVIALAKTKIA